MGVFSEAVEVKCSPSGQPERVVWRGRVYRVVVEPVRWFERRKWWEEEPRAEPGRGAGLVDHEIWRLQLRPDDGPGSSEGPGSSRGSGLRTLDISHRLDTHRWRLVRIHDAVRDRGAE
jgi:hypothetical protein